jgi:hypothetical protein
MTFEMVALVAQAPGYKVVAVVNGRDSNDASQAYQQRQSVIFTANGRST